MLTRDGERCSHVGAQATNTRSCFDDMASKLRLLIGREPSPKTVGGVREPEWPDASEAPKTEEEHRDRYLPRLRDQTHDATTTNGRFSARSAASRTRRDCIRHSFELRLKASRQNELQRSFSARDEGGIRGHHARHPAGECRAVCSVRLLERPAMERMAGQQDR
jgi:hypothetical protein